jgi:Holliday junction resolvase-like predicted endonuclease
MGANTNNLDLLGSAILNVCPPGKYLGREAQIRLNEIARSIHSTIISLCRQYSERDLLTTFYDMFDKACYHIISGEYWLTKNISLIRKFEVAPKVFSYLINTVLYSRSESSKQPEKSELDATIKLASLLIETCNYSDFLFYTRFDEGFEISSTGELNFIKSKRTKVLEKRFIQKVGRRRLTVKSKELWGETKSWKELSKPYDSNFKQRYGISLSDVSEIITQGLRNVKKFIGTITASYREFLKNFRKGLELPRSTVRRAIRLFELDRETLLVNWRYHKLYEMRPSASRQPILRISGRVGKDGVVMFGPNALLRALALLFADVDRGIVDFGQFSRLWLQQKGPKFERKVRNLFKKYGFKVIHITKTTSKVGEIDCIAYKSDRGILFVVEAKSPKIDLSAKEIKWQIQNTQKWYSQLRKKSEWVKANLSIVAELLGITLEDIHEVKDIVVVKVPTFSDESISSKIITVEDLFYMLEGLL